MDPRDQFATIKRLGQKVIGAEPETLQFVVEFGKTRKDQDRSANPRRAQAAQHLVTINIRKHQVKQNNIIVVKLADLQPVFTEVGCITNKVLLLQHHLDAGGCSGVVLD